MVLASQQNNQRFKCHFNPQVFVEIVPRPTKVCFFYHWIFDRLVLVFYQTYAFHIGKTPPVDDRSRRHLSYNIQNLHGNWLASEEDEYFVMAYKIYNDLVYYFIHNLLYSVLNLSLFS